MRSASSPNGTPDVSCENCWYASTCFNSRGCLRCRYLLNRKIAMIRPITVSGTTTPIATLAPVDNPTSEVVGTAGVDDVASAPGDVVEDVADGVVEDVSVVEDEVERSLDCHAIWTL